MADPILLSQIEFAKLMSADKSRVSRWIAEGKIGPEALIGTGRSRRINVDLAKAHLSARLDAGQALGNGAKTKSASSHAERRSLRATQPVEIEVEPGSIDDLDPSSPEYQRQRARLVRAQAEAQEMKNAIARGDLESKTVREAIWGEVIAGTRSEILAVVGRVRERHPDLSAAHIKTIDAELRAALTKLSTGDFLA